jgi:Leucine-rich repeat (LRR) protein
MNLQQFFKHFRFILLAIVCLIGADLERKLNCYYDTTDSYTLWPSNARSTTNQIDFSADFESDNHNFTGTPEEKSEVKTFRIRRSLNFDFIPLEILSEFPNLNGLAVEFSKLPTLKAGLFKPELEKLEYLHLGYNEVEVIEPKAFQYLVKLKFISFYENKLKALPHRLFKNNPDLVYINFEENQINSIHPNFFDGLASLKMVEFGSRNLCIRINVGCGNCSDIQSDLKTELKKCFGDNEKDTSSSTSTFNQDHRFRFFFVVAALQFIIVFFIVYSDISDPLHLF